ncbi:hypothetical protein D9M70_562700 [compost metagenome]
MHLRVRTSPHEFRHPAGGAQCRPPTRTHRKGCRVHSGGVPPGTDAPGAEPGPAARTRPPLVHTDELSPGAGTAGFLEVACAPGSLLADEPMAQCPARSVRAQQADQPGDNLAAALRQCRWPQATDPHADGTAGGAGRRPAAVARLVLARRVLPHRRTLEGPGRGHYLGDLRPDPADPSAVLR